MPVKIRVAVALRMLAGASYIDVAVLFGIAKETVFHVLWQVVDAINSTPAIGPFFFPQTVDDCTRAAVGGVFMCVCFVCVLCVCVLPAFFASSTACSENYST